MRRYIWTVATALLLTACATVGQHGAESPADEIRTHSLSSNGPSREGSDQACRIEAAAFDRALTRAGDADAIMDTFDAVALCRKAEARRLAASQPDKTQAGAALIGLRGAMRRDVERLRAALLNPGDNAALSDRIARATDLENVLIQPDS